MPSIAERSSGLLLDALWSAYQRDEAEVERQRQADLAREDALPQLRGIVADFSQGRNPLSRFKERMNRFSADQGKLWGFQRSGQRTVNQLADSAADQDVPAIRAALAPPPSINRAVEQIAVMVRLCRALRGRAKDAGGTQAAPSPGFMPYLLSFLWQPCDRDAFPVYFPRARSALARLGLFEETGEHGRDYARFAAAMAVARQRLGVDTWQVEHACLWFHTHPFVGFVAPDFEVPTENGRINARHWNARAGYDSPGAAEEARRNLRQVLDRLEWLSEDLRPELDELLPAYPVKVCAERTSLSEEARYRDHAWLYAAADTPGGGRAEAMARVWVARGGLYAGLYLSPAADGAALAETIPSVSELLTADRGLAVFTVGTDGVIQAHQDQGDSTRGILVARRWAPDEAVGRGRALKDDILDVLRQIAPVLHEMAPPPLPTPEPEHRATAAMPVKRSHYPAAEAAMPDEAPVFDPAGPDVYVKLTDSDAMTAEEILEAHRAHAAEHGQVWFGWTLSMTGIAPRLNARIRAGSLPVLCIGQPAKGLVAFGRIYDLVTGSDEQPPPDRPDLLPSHYGQKTARARTWLRLGRIYAGNELGQPVAATDFTLFNEPDRRLSEVIGRRPSYVYIRYTPAVARLEDRPLALPTAEQFDEGYQRISQELAVDREVVARIVTHLVAGKSVILTGPTGSGKTVLSKLIPRAFFNMEPYLVTATNDWTSYEVIGGIAPHVIQTPDGGSQLTYGIRRGHVYEAVLRNWQTDTDGRLLLTNGAAARRVEERDGRVTVGTWLVIDELNRADIDQAFGDLFTAIESLRLRVPAINAEGSGAATEMLPIPRHFRIIGTMNSFDRSYLHAMSDALKRRFAFVDVGLPADLGHEREKVRARVLKRLHEMGIDGDDETLAGAEDMLYGFLGLLRVFHPIGVAQAMACLDYAAVGSGLVGLAPEARIQEALLANVLPQIEHLPAPHLACMSGWAGGGGRGLVDRLAAIAGSEDPSPVRHADVVAVVGWLKGRCAEGGPAAARCDEVARLAADQARGDLSERLRELLRGGEEGTGLTTLLEAEEQLAAQGMPQVADRLEEYLAERNA